jgi:hypothetical protein
MMEPPEWGEKSAEGPMFARWRRSCS